ncbi:hypothetical protein H5410_027952 [Solanum commersonii]|uniref:Uncharacterized protein n=1 Tax=Solanum commersonii TaxID=4109 RepID=A0A9J5Z4V1_SOLCO|nr:hypothetical protein H5410_027952 [Solanum commersonii]
MKSLKILQIRNFDCDRYPWKSLSKTFEHKRLVHLNLSFETIGRIKPKLHIHMGYSEIIEEPSFIMYQTHITKLNLSSMKKPCSSSK